MLLIVAGGIIAIVTDAKRDSSGNVTREGSVSVNDLRIGDCIKSVRESSTVATLPAVPCSQPHQGEVFGEFELSGSSYPGEDAMDRQVQAECDTRLISYTSAKTIDEVKDMYYVYPRESDWRRGSRTVTCIATHAERTGSLKG